MFNCSIEKSFKYDCINIFIPVDYVDNDFLILISHGSGGVGEGEKNIANYFLKNGYTIGIVDYFSKHKIQKLLWTDNQYLKDKYNIPFVNLFDIDIPNYKNIIHVGLSLGATLGLYKNNMFTKNYCFYPGILGLSEKLLQKDFSNTTVFTAELDNWCINYTEFENLCSMAPKRIFVKDSYHGFMIPGKQRQTPVVKYNTISKILDDNTFKLLSPNHDMLSEIFEYTREDIHLQFNQEQCIICLDAILEDIKNL